MVGIGVVAGCVVPREEGGGREEPGLPIEVRRVESGWQVWFGDAFYLPVKEGDAFQLRQTILSLRRIEGATQRRGSRATRDGRRPLIPQQQLARGFGVPQPDISRWERYALEEDWANLLSLHSAEVLTVELRQRIVDVCAQFPWWAQQRVYEHLRQCGVAVTHRQVRQAIEESGWHRLRETMSRFFVVSAECMRPRDQSLVIELLRVVQELLTKLESGEGLVPEEQLEIAHLQTMCEELGLTPPPTPPAVPWAQKLAWVLFGAQTTAEEGQIRCTYCGSRDVRPKGRKPRLKRYLDEHHQWQTVEVYRYRCRNPACRYGSFTHFPLGLMPYSPYRLEMRTTALQMYAWGWSSYRRTAQALGVRAGRVYLWVRAFGQQLLPMAALFGVVRCSGVIGKAKGYKPKAIVTDLRPEYGAPIAQVFDHARHHQCIFHALQWMHRQLKEAYGADYAQTHPEVVKLKKQIDAIFQARRTRRTAEKRYTRVIALRENYVTQTPQAASVFDTLEHHWPKLVNGMESTIIPRTNNATELVIRRFDQHYQNFCGFESLQSARLFLAVFEKVYRFTPFTPDAQPRIRGKCPLELAGYDIAKLPMAQICRGWALSWPAQLVKEVVPNV
jgi:DNA-directed RNA polymerase subunit RPC12/RpoP